MYSQTLDSKQGLCTALINNLLPLPLHRNSEAKNFYPSCRRSQIGISLPLFPRQSKWNLEIWKPIDSGENNNFSLFQSNLGDLGLNVRPHCMGHPSVFDISHLTNITLADVPSSRVSFLTAFTEGYISSHIFTHGAFITLPAGHCDVSQASQAYF